MPRGPRGPIEKPKDRKKVLLRLWTYLYAHKWMSLGAVLLTVGSNLLALLGPMLSGRAIDAIGVEPGQADFPTIFLYCGLMVAFYAVSSLLSYILSILMIQLSQKIVYQMRQQVFNRLTELPVGYFDTHQTGDIVSRISYDIDTVNASLSNDLVQIAASVITVVGSFLMMVVISPVLVLVFAVTIPMSILFTRYMTRESPAPVPHALGAPGGAQRLCGGEHHRPKDHQGLPPGGDHDLPLRRGRTRPRWTATTTPTTTAA